MVACWGPAEEGTLSSIPGIPGASEPSFRTRDDSWVSLDTLVRSTCARLEEIGEVVSPLAAKAVIQVGRDSVQRWPERQGDALMHTVSDQLRHQRLIVVPRLVREILVAYTSAVVELDVAEVVESRG